MQGNIYPAGDFRIMKILAKLIQILPLNLAVLGQNTADETMSRQMKEGLDFLKVFATNEIVDKYEITIKVAAQFRAYQLEGINWMAKLGSFNLSCALCDDMGLGKTL
jgi:SNF2 family DNA or RNA helicase